jgi:alpha-L-rhamnosidase
MTATVVRLGAEYRADAFGVGTPTPRLSWVTETSAAGWSQAGYEISRFSDDHPVETIAVSSIESVFVPWPFAPLTSRQRCSVQVRVTGRADDVSDWSAPLAVEAGLLAPTDWLATPITADLAGEAAERPIRFRRQFDVGHGLVSARLYCSAYGIYTAECNGAPVSDELLTPGWTSYAHRLRYATRDVTDLLRPGGNALGFTVAEGWYRGRLGFLGGRRENYGQTTGPIAQLELTYADGSRQTVVTDGQWRAATGPYLYACLYDGERYDARLAADGWSSPGFDDSLWAPVAVSPSAAERLQAPVGPPVRRIETLAPVAVSTSPSGRTLVDFGQNISGWVRFRVTGEVGRQITIRHAEVLEHGELGTRPLRLAAATDTFILAGTGEEVYEPTFTIHGFRYAEVTGWPGELAGDAIEAVVVHSQMTPTGTFRSSHSGLNRLHDNVRWSMRGNFVDLPTDCPQRDERLGWTGDIQVFTPTACFLYDCAGLLASWLADLAAEQVDLGTVTAYVPWISLIFPPMAFAAWGDAAVIVPWQLYQRFGDIGVLGRQYASMRAWVDGIVARLDADGLWSGGVQLGDWLDPAAPPDKPAAARTDRTLVAQAYHAHTSHLLAEAATALGNDADAANYRTLADRAAAAFVREFATPSGRLSSDAPTAYALGLQFDLLPALSQRVHAADRLGDLVGRDGHHIGTGFVGTPLICDALADAGRLDDAYLLLLNDTCPSWLYPVTMGATTIWERWDSMLPDGSINPGEMTSFNHYALGAVADFLHRTVAGLAPAAPGYRSLRVAPRPGGGLTEVEATHLTPYGLARIHWRRVGARLLVDLLVPPSTSATVTLPGCLPVDVSAGTHHFECDHRAASDDPLTPPRRNMFGELEPAGEPMDHPAIEHGAPRD